MDKALKSYNKLLISAGHYCKNLVSISPWSVLDISTNQKMLCFLSEKKK